MSKQAITHKRTWFRFFLQVFGLCAMVLAKPLFDLLLTHPEYLVVNRIEPTTLYVFVVGIALALPLALTLIVESAAIISNRLRTRLRSTLVAGLLGVFALQLASRVQFLPVGIIPIFAVTVAILVVVGTALTYGRVRALPLTLVVLSPVGILFPVLFLANPVIRDVLHPDQMPTAWLGGAQATSLESKPPIFMLVFDEFSLVDLLDSSGQIDAGRFPNFAGLASNSTWYSNTTTVRHATTWAIPAILTGRRAKDAALPRYDHYPENIFSLLEGHYNFHVVEPVTELYKANTHPQIEESTDSARGLGALTQDMGVVFLHFSLPEAYRQYLPSISSSWGGFVGSARDKSPVFMGDEEREHAKKVQEARYVNHLMKSNRLGLVMSFISSIDAYPLDTLHFLHVLLPHRPSIHLPSGRVYTQAAVRGVHEEQAQKSWVGPQHLVDRLHQAHLLQLAMVDTLVGRLIMRMKNLGIYDESLLVVVADHGVSFQEGVSNRRPSPINYGDLAFVPLLIKYPNQHNGVLDESNVETIDILPTIADAIGAAAGWGFDGRSLIDSSAAPRPIKVLKLKADRGFNYSEEQYLKAKREALERNRRAFSLDDPRADLYRYGPGLELVGRSVSELESRDNCKVRSSSLTYFQQVNLNYGYLPTHIQGEVSCSGVDPVNHFVVAVVNGIVEVAVHPYRFEGEIIFDFVIPEMVFHNGHNDVELLMASGISSKSSK